MPTPNNVSMWGVPCTGAEWGRLGSEGHGSSRSRKQPPNNIHHQKKGSPSWGTALGRSENEEGGQEAWRGGREKRPGKYRGSVCVTKNHPFQFLLEQQQIPDAQNLGSLP